jgi:ParB-like chromosome segregation protein Spo0J
MNVRELPIELLLEADWNANRVPAKLLAKIRGSLTQFGIVENLVARPHPKRPGLFEVISGNHRLRLLCELGFTVVPGYDRRSAHLCISCINDRARRPNAR